MNCGFAGADYTFPMRRHHITFWSALFAVLWLCSAPPSVAAAEKARSVLLIAAEGMADSRFRQSVVLVTRHGRSSETVGVIVNRATDVSLGRLFPELTPAMQHRLHYGGPVAPGKIVFLLRSEAPPVAAIAMAENLFLSSDAGSLKQLLAASTPVTRLRVFSGFASWAPDQLEGEIDRGDWHLLPVDTDVLFNGPLGEMWPRLWRRATRVMVRAPSVEPANARREPRMTLQQAAVGLDETDYFPVPAARILAASSLHQQESP